MFKVNLLNNFYFTTKFSQLVKSGLSTHGGAGAKAPDLPPLSEAAPAKRIFAGASEISTLVKWTFVKYRNAGTKPNLPPISKETTKRIFASTSKYLFLFLIFNCSSSIEIYKKPKYGVNLEYLTTSEKFLLDYYSDKEIQTKALEKLKSFCENDITDFHSCYNLAVLKYHLGEKKEALRYAQLAHERKPDDFLYELMLKTVGLEELQTVNLEGFSKDFYDFELACKRGELKNFSLLETWIKSGLITKASLNAGMFANCLSKPQKEELLKLAKNNPVNYADEYYKDKAKSDPFYEIWDAEHLIRKQNIEEQKKVNAKLTQLWKEFRLAVKFSQKPKAKETLQEFLKEVGQLQEKHKFKPLAIKLTALKRASYLLIEQDEFFKNNRELLQVFGDKALQ